MKITKPILMNAIKERNYVIDDYGASYLADLMLKHYDSRLEQNLIEFIEGKEISDIWIDGYCVNGIMSIRGDNDFCSAFYAMCEYLKDPERGTIIIWNGKARL